MDCYSCLTNEAKIRKISSTPDNLIALKKQLQNENIYMLEKINDGNIHGEAIMKEKIKITMNNLLDSTHSIEILPNTILHNIYQRSKKRCVK